MEIGLIGCGRWGQLILRDLLTLGVKVHVIDSDTTALEAATAAGASTVDRELNAIGEVEGIIVATEATTHADIITSLDHLGSTAPIFCEKPLADNSTNADRLINREGPPLFVMHIWCYHPGIRKLKELYEQGLIGELTQIRSTRCNWTSPRMDVDSLFNLAPHDLSIFQYILGDILEPSYAMGEYIDGRLVGCTALFKNPAEPDCILEVSNRYAEKRREVRLHGSKGVLVLPDDTSGVVQHIAAGGYIRADEVKDYHYDQTSALVNELETFLNAISNNDFSLLCSAENGAQIVYAIDKIGAILNVE